MTGDKTTYECANCGDECGPDDEWTEDDARAEAAANGFDPDGDMVAVCDDCFDRMRAWDPDLKALDR